MIRKLCYFSVMLVALGGLVIGCSDDISRVTSPEVETQWDDFLSTNNDEPGVIIDIDGYIAQGYYYPEGDTPVDDGLGEYTYDGLPYDPPSGPLDDLCDR